MLEHYCKAKPFIFPIFHSRKVNMTIFLQVCGCIEVKKLDKVLLFNILIKIANVESLFLFRFLWFSCLLNFWYWVFTTWCCDWLLYSWFAWPLKMLFLFLVGSHLSEMMCCFLFVVVVCFKEDFPEQRFEFSSKS